MNAFGVPAGPRRDVDPAVSVVVPTCERPALLARCLAALLAQDVSPETFEVLIVDDGPTAATRRLVQAEALRARPAIRYVAAGPRRGPARARNLGWRAARGDIVAFTDDDCLPSPGWLRAGLAALGPGVAGACGRIVVPLVGRPTDYERDATGLEQAVFATANCFYRRAALLAVGGFDERFAKPWREDSDVFFSLLERDGRLVRAPNAVVVHPPRPAPWGVSLGQQRKSLFNALLYKKHPRLYRQWIQPSPPWRYYATTASLLLAVASAAAGRVEPAAAGWGAWALLTARFCLARLRDTSRAPRHVAEMIVTSALIPPLAVFWRLRGALKFRVLFL